MALSDKEKQRIVEEETLRFETHKRLEQEHCSNKCRGKRWPYILLLLVVLFFAAKMLCRHHGSCPYGSMNCPEMMQQTPVPGK